MPFALLLTYSLSATNLESYTNYIEFSIMPPFALNFSFNTKVANWLGYTPINGNDISTNNVPDIVGLIIKLQNWLTAAAQVFTLRTLEKALRGDHHSNLSL